jgi:hypothetical protein
MAVSRTVNAGHTFITIGSLDSDYNYTTDYPDHSNGIRVHSIEFVPSGWATDVCQIKDGGASGPVIFNAASLNRYQIKYFNGAWLKPYYDISDTNKCVASATAKIIIHLGGYSS